MHNNKREGGFPPSLIPRFAIGTPGSPQPAMLRSIMALEKPPGTPFLDAGMGTPGTQKLDIAAARNQLIEDFLTCHETFDMPEPLNWLLMVDGDAVLHPKTLHRLQSWNRAIVSALAVIRYKPYMPIVYRGLCKQTAPDMRSYYVQPQEVLDWVQAHPELVTLEGYACLDDAPDDALHQVDWTGSHCFLCHRSVFEKVPRPWFEIASTVKYGSGSDRLFFEKAAAAGFTINVDYSVVAGHQAEMTLGMADFAAWQSITIAEDDPDSPATHYVGDDLVVSPPASLAPDHNPAAPGETPEASPAADHPQPAPRSPIPDTRPHSSPPFFILTTGRSGSLSLALTLNQHPLLCCLHEPHPHLIPAAHERANGATLAGSLADWFADHVLAPPGPQIVGWSDQKLAGFVPDLLAAFPRARLLHLVRDGRDVVASGLARGWYTPAEADYPPHAWALYRLQADEIGDVPAVQWQRWDPFARNCWYWSYINRTIRQALDVDHRNHTVQPGTSGALHRLLRLEDLDPEALNSLQLWLGVQPLDLYIHHANATDPGRLRPWQQWTDEQRATFDKICGPEMDHLYPHWRES